MRNKYSRGDSPSFDGLHNAKVGILSLGIGNVKAVEGSLRRLNISHTNVNSYHGLKAVTHLIIPGVGAMRTFMERLEIYNLKQDLKSFAGYGNILGICLGFQALYDYSHEDDCECLGLLPGSVKPIRSVSSINTNVGYRSIKKATKNLNLDIIPETTRDLETSSSTSVNSDKKFYFTHSYYVPLGPSTIYTSELENSFCFTAVSSNGDNIVGLQFHPELSHIYGRNIFSKFIGIL